MSSGLRKNLNFFCFGFILTILNISAILITLHIQGANDYGYW